MKEYNNELANLDNVEILGFTGKIESIPKTLEQVETIRNSCCDVGIIQLMNADSGKGTPSARSHSCNQCIQKRGKFS
ncbi:hypothetical protein [uncultured Methanobrevibacter sp.]|uniref:hypothetical protein n=1 Tax=uncultured Methanobrevibacter sp. TaxID=253161 RepID=UPI0025E61754|nr:hypothetical protein [uncultured Methanobrevibacter sp.]